MIINSRSLAIIGFKSSEGGASLVEFALIAPFVFILIFVMIFFALTFNAKRNLEHATSMGRLALTRAHLGNPALLGTVPAIDAWEADPGCSSPAAGSVLLDILSYETNDATIFNDNGYYDKVVSKKFNLGGGNNFCLDSISLPRSYRYAIVFAYLVMIQGVRNVRTGCDPTTPGGVGAGCFQCILENPNDHGYGPPNPTNASFDDGFIGLTCQFHPDVLLWRPINYLFALVTGQNPTDPGNFVLEKTLIFTK